MDKQTIVLPSARAIRHEQQQLTEISLFLPNYITMGDFISKLCIVKDHKFIDDDSRVLLLLEASDFENFSSLQIERNFFTFTKNSSYIFKFFAELSAELYDIEALSASDIYGEYEEHISILIELYKRYEQLCSDRKYLDKIFLPKLYTFNAAYAKTHTSLSLKIDGHLTNFEFELLEQCCEYTDVTIHFTASAFNTKMQSRFEELGISLNAGFSYTLSLNTKEILEQTAVIKNSNVSCESFSETLLQVAFVKKKIADFVSKGYAPQNIAVILPNETIAQRLKSFDTKANLNFAMGESFSKSQLYLKLQATTKAIELSSHENRERIVRVGDELYEKIQSVYYKSAQEVDFILFLEGLSEFFISKKEIKIYEEEIFSFNKLISFMSEMSLKSLFNLFMQRLASRTVDDIRGGKVTVMGVLETRSVAFDGVIIVDFDDKNVPKRSDKDMFLNSQVREMAKLPTMSDRENLQKHYYEMLINASKEVAISYVSATQSSGSRFLKQLGIEQSMQHEEGDYSEILFELNEQKSEQFEDKTIAYSFKDIKISSSRLKTYLSCKRHYYYKYIKGIKGHKIPQDMPEEYEIGNTVHLALKELYSNQNYYEDPKQLKSDLDKALDAECGKSELDKYLIALQKKRLTSFAVAEVAHFAKGYRVHSCEEYFEIPYEGLTLMGFIDRVDKRESSVSVLDYKTGSYKLYNKNNFMDATDFQLEFYYLLAGSLGSVESCSFYDLKEVKIVPESFLNEKLEVLKSIINDLKNVEELDTKQCEDLSHCLYCDYKIMCQRG